MTRHPAFAHLALTCAKLINEAKPFRGLGFRFASLKYAHAKDLLSGVGAKRSGGRINGIGTFRVVYTSTDPETATAETYQNFASFGFDLSKATPRVLVGIEIEISAVLDLCETGVREQLNLSLTDLTAPWWPVQEGGAEAMTQAIGRAAYLTGFEAVKLPSARRPEGINLNVFPVKLRTGSRMAVISEADLAQYLK